MARPVSGKTIEDMLWVKQPNGTYYCYRRKRVCEGGKVKTIGKDLLGKADTKGGELRPTRAKRPSKRNQDHCVVQPIENNGQSSITASRKHVGMMDIIDFIGNVSGIDEDLYAITDRPTAEKILSLARYIVASDGATFPGIQEWMFTHPLPYAYPITEDVYLNLFHDVGLDESLRQSYFQRRFARESDLALIIAYDSSTEISVSKNPEARLGMNKDDNGKTAVKILVLYSLKSRRPLAYAKQPANIPDVSSIENALSQLKALDVDRVSIVTDCGFTSDDNLAMILRSRNHSLTKVKISLKWVRPEIDAHLDELRSASSIMPCDYNTKGRTVPVTHEFTYHRLYGSKSKGLSAGDEDTFKKRIYLHIYYDTKRKEEDDRAFIADIMDIKELVENQSPLSASAIKKADRYLNTRVRGETVTVTLKNKEIDKACKYNGMFALVSDNIKDANTALELYRKREWIEDYFERFKQVADGDTSRTGHPDKLNGRMFVQFIAMSYIEELHERLRQIKSNLGIANGDPVHDAKENLDAENELKTWLKKRSLYRTLNWFDANDMVEVSNDIKRVRWNTETVKRDDLFLSLLGVTEWQSRK